MAKGVVLVYGTARSWECPRCAAGVALRHPGHGHTAINVESPPVRKDQDHKMRTTSGDRPQTNGWLVFRTFDLAPNSALPKPQNGWQIVELFSGTDQAQTVDYLIEEVRHESQLRGRPLLLYAEFQHNRDRSRKDPA